MDNQVTTTGGTMRRLVAALIIAVSVAIVWGVVIGWAASLVEGWMRGDTQIYENFVVRRDGTPAIQTYSSRDYEDISYRTLDGQPLEMKNDEHLEGAYLAEPVRPPRFFDWPSGWGSTWGLSDFAKPRNSWYVVQLSDADGRAYIAGFNEASQMPIGYIGRSGFRRALPPNEEWFEMGDRSHRRTEIASTGYAAYNAPANQYYGTQTTDIPNWWMFLIDGDWVTEVDLQARTVKRLLEAPGAISVGILALPLAAEDGKLSRLEKKTTPRLAVRTSDRIIAFDPRSDWRQEFTLPESLRDTMLMTHLLSNEQLLVTWTPDRKKYNVQTLAWLNPDGTIAREETAILVERATIDISDRQAATLAVGMVPVPTAWAAVVGVFAPIAMISSNEEPTYAAAMKKILDVCLPGLVLATVIGVFCAWLVRRWQRKYFRPATSWWCAFAFLLGVPGLIAYWLEHHRAKLEECRECHATAPRDRDACAACNTLFPAPPLVGTEVFA